MQTLGGIIRARRHELGLTLERLAAAVGCHKSYLSQIENDRRPEGTSPSEPLLVKLERSLRLPEGRLLRIARWNSLAPDVREDVKAMETARRAAQRLAALLKSHSLDDAHASGELQALVEQIDRSGAGADGGSPGKSSAGSRGNVEIHPLPLQVPLINSVRAGYPTEFTDLGYPARVADEYVSVPELHDPDAFAARVVGDSMAPEYREGDIVVFSPERDATSGADCFVRFERDGETTFKRVFFEREPPGAGNGQQAAGREGIREQGSGIREEGEKDAARGTEDDAPSRIRLQPLNPMYAARTVDREEIAGMYAAVWVIRAAPKAPAPGSAPGRVAARA